MSLTISQINKKHPEYALSQATDAVVDMSDEHISDLLQYFCNVNVGYDLDEQFYFQDQCLLLGQEDDVHISYKPLPYANHYKIWNIHFTLLQDYLEQEQAMHNGEEIMSIPTLYRVDNLPSSLEEAATTTRYFTVSLLKFPVNDTLVTVLRFEYNKRDKPRAYYEAVKRLRQILGAETLNVL